MNLSRLFANAERFLSNNSPTILTALGVTGTITTAFLTAKATVRAVELIAEETKEARTSTGDSGYEFHNKAKAKLVWTLYIPPVGTCVVTIVSIILANRIGMRRAAAIAAAYSVSERAFAEYRDQVVERMGDRRERNMRDEIAQDRVAKTPVREVIMTDGGRVLCFDTMSGRYFESDMEHLRKAQNDMNYQILNDTYATLHDFYKMIGLPPTRYSSEVGWSSSQLLEIHFATCLSENGRPCISIDYSSYPIRDYYHE